MEFYDKVMYWRCFNGNEKLYTSSRYKDYIIGVHWKAPEKPYGDTWVLKSYSNKETGNKDLSKDQINEFLNTINAN
jgi:hypothetical protein